MITSSMLAGSRLMLTCKVIEELARLLHCLLVQASFYTQVNIEDVYVCMHLIISQTVPYSVMEG